MSQLFRGFAVRWQPLTSLLPLLALLPLISAHGNSDSRPFFLAALVAFASRFSALFAALRLECNNKNFAADLRAAVPEKVMVFIDADIEGELESGKLDEGCMIRVMPEQNLAADGVVSLGSSFVSEEIFGHPDPRAVGMGSRVFAGSTNGKGSFLYRVSSKGSALARLADALTNGLPGKFPMGALWALDVLLYATAIFAYWRGGTEAAYQALLASGSAALAASLMVRDSSLVARSAASGFAWDSRDSVKRFARSSCFVAGRERATVEDRLRLTALGGLGDAALIRLLAPLARRVESPEAYALLLEARLRGIPLEPLDEEGRLDGNLLEWVEDAPGIDGGPAAAFASEHRAAGESIVFLKIDGKIAGAAAFAAEVLPDARAAVELMRNDDAPFLLVTKACRGVADRTARELETSHVHADADANAFRALMERLSSDGLAPAWVRAGELAGWSGKGACVAELTDSRPADLRLIRTDLGSVARAWLLARRYAVAGQWAALLCLAGQLSLGLSHAAPLTAAFACAGISFVTLALAYRLRITSLDH